MLKFTFIIRVSLDGMKTHLNRVHIIHLCWNFLQYFIFNNLMTIKFLENSCVDLHIEIIKYFINQSISTEFVITWKFEMKFWWLDKLLYPFIVAILISIYSIHRAHSFFHSSFHSTTYILLQWTQWIWYTETSDWSVENIFIQKIDLKKMWVSI